MNPDIWSNLLLYIAVLCDKRCKIDLKNNYGAKD